MKIRDFSESDISFMIELLEKRQLSRKNQNSYGSAPAFYMGTWFLRDNGLIKVVGVDGSRHVVYKLTPKGEKIAKLFKELRRLISND